MKKLIAIAMTAAMLLAFGCAKTPAEPMNVAALKGPTGLGISYLMDEDTENYSVELYDAPDVVVGKFVSGEIDVAAVPINLASTLYNKTEGNVVVLCIDTLGVLYVVENGDTVNSFEDLAGKTISATGEGSTPQYVLDYLLDAYGLTDQVTVEYAGEHTELAALLASGETELGMLPEPFVSSVTLKNPDARIALDLNEAWEEASGTKLVQGVYIANRDYYNENPDLIKNFLKDYADSVNRVNTEEGAASLIAQLGIVASEEIAAQAIPRSNIVCITGDDMVTAAGAMLNVLYGANPASVGGALPGDDFYYEG
ncbi:MAG TPA: ABC transporter substrate-binding protein [Eubacteriales bacterium]|nr:ABC transporter substrate-binding protein [Eubacteriales bacterium]